MSTCDNIENMGSAPQISNTTSGVLRPARKREEYTVGWICALPLEKAAATAMLDVRHKPLPKMTNDCNTYEYGSMCGHNVVIACLPSGEYGLSSATSVAKDMLRSFSIRVGLMVGIGGGVPKHDIHLGDVVISKPSEQHGGVVQYDFGKSIADSKFIRTGTLNSPPRALLAALSSLQSDIEMWGNQSERHIRELVTKYPHMKNTYASPELLKDILFKPEDEHSGNDSCEPCLSHFVPLRESTGGRPRKVHYGLIASGNQVIKDAKKRDSISNDMGDNVLCFEMEAAGLMNDFPCLVIRGICDYSDSHKNKEWQRYAAAVAAAEAKELLRYIAKDDVLGTPVSATQKLHWVVPFSRNKNFVGREAQLKEIMDKLALDDYDDHCQRVAIAGLGGIGKTQLALETAFKVREQSCSVFWISAVDIASFETSYRKVGQELQVAGIDNDKADVKSLVAVHLSREDVGRWLLIVDNADDLKALYTRQGEPSEGHNSLPLADYLPNSRLGSILFTTRNHQVAVKHAENNVITVREMNENESLELLRKSLRNGTPGAETGALELLKLLTYLPLAIKQAAAYINEQQESIDGYLEICKESDQELIYMLSRDFEDQGRYERTTNPIALTWLISFRQIKQMGALATEYLCFMSLVAMQKIPHSLLPTALKSKESEAIGTLKAYAFITSHEGGKMYDIHRLVQLSVRNWLKREGELNRRSCEVLTQVSNIFPFFTHEKRDECTLYFPHAEYILSFRDFQEDMSVSLSDLLHNVGEYFFRTGKYSEAEERYYQAFNLKRTALGDTHESTLASMNNLAAVYRNQGKHKEAEALQQQTLKLRRATLGNTHPSTLDSMNNLAVIFGQQGKYKEAETLQQQTLKLKKAVLGNNHPRTIDSMNNLAEVYRHQGKYLEAETLQQQTLELKRATLGDTHPSTLDSMNNLAVIYEQQGKYKEGEILQKQTLELKRATLSDTHPSTLDSMTNLAEVYREQGKYKEAEALQQQVLELRRATLGDTHPSTLESISNLAEVYKEQGKYKEAETQQKQALELRRTILSDTHPSTLESISNLAEVYRHQGKYKEAETLQQQALALRRAILSDTHPSTLQSMNNLAIIYEQQGKYKEAETLQQLTLELKMSTLGDTHPSTLRSMNNLAVIYEKQGRNTEAKALDQQMLELKRKREADE